MDKINNQNAVVSIIIPTYNRAHLIGETLDSVLAQTYPHWECIVVDDGSTDDTEKVIKEYISKDARFQFYNRPPQFKSGGSGARNYGFLKSRGEYIKWLDSDDLLSKKSLELNIKFIKSGDFDVVVSPLFYFDKDPLNPIKSNAIESDNLIEDYLTGKIAFYVSPPLWKRVFLERQDKLFDETISNLDDWDFNLRMLYQKPNLKLIQEPLVYYRVHQNSLSKEIEKLNSKEIASEWEAREKHLQLIKKNKLIQPEFYKDHMLNRLVYLYKVSMIKKHSISFSLLVKLIKMKLQNYQYGSSLKTLFWFLIFKTTNKGYKYLK